MIRMKPYLLCLILCLTGWSQTSIYSQDSDQTPGFVNEFLNIGVGARAHGMFGSVVSNVDDVTAAFWNPAGLSRIESPFQVSAMHTNWFGGIANYDHLSFGKSINPEKGAFGSITLIRMGIDNIPNTLSLIGPDGTVDYSNISEFSASDYGFFISYGQKILNDKLRVGGSIKVINRSIGQFAKAWGFGFDAGVQYQMGNIALGVMAKDITSTFNAWSFNFTDEEKEVFLRTGNIIPESSTEIALPRFILGASYKMNTKNINWLFESNLNLSTVGQKAGLISGRSVNIDPTIGVEAGLNDKVFIRAGIGNIQRLLNEVNTAERSLSFQPNIGLGLNLGQIKIDYALTNIGNASDVLVSHIFSATLNFEPRTRVTEEETLEIP